jgi:hypothetical protein
MKITADQGWWITADGRRVSRDHPDARRLLVGKGCEIDESELAKYPPDEAEAKAIAAPAETKAVKAPRRR